MQQCQLIGVDVLMSGIQEWHATHIFNFKRIYWAAQNLTERSHLNRQNATNEKVKGLEKSGGGLGSQ